MGSLVAMVMKRDNADLAVFPALEPIPEWKMLVRYSITSLAGGVNGSVCFSLQKSIHLLMYGSCCRHMWLVSIVTSEVLSLAANTAGF